MYLFSGLVVCGDCGRLMTRKVSTVAGKKYAYYMCSVSKRDGTCTSHRIREEELEEAVALVLNAYVEKLSGLKEILGYIETLPMQSVRCGLCSWKRKQKSMPAESISV